MAAHELSPLPQRLAKLLVHSKDKGLAAKVEVWLAKNSDGIYPRIHLWLDDADNHELRYTLGTKMCEIIESGHTALLEE